MRRFDEAQSRREATYRRLRGVIFNEGETAKYKELAAELGMTEGALRVTVHRLRRQFGDTLREVIAETVERDEAIDDELRHLLEIVSETRSLE